jgi:phosphatidylethanolamine/phosphatidyl-N-methylethanolamine N-methyltransferase
LRELKKIMAAEQKSLNLTTVREAYRRWAPVYDSTFGLVASAGRRKAIEQINQRRGNVLEVGVGTGLSLPHYAPYLKITGIDLSPEMLAKARERVEKAGLLNIEGLYEMDAAQLEFPDDSFNTVVAMYVMTVVPDPDKVMAELERVCAPGGEVMIVNHFSQDHGLRGWVERKMAPYADTLGWHPVFPIERVMVRPGLSLIERRPLWPMGLFTLVRFRKLRAAA